MSLNEEMISKELNAILGGDIERSINRVSKYAWLKSLFVKIHHKINFNATYDFDSDFVNSLSNEQLSNFIKFFTLFETNYYNRHSVTAIPYLLNLLSKRNYENYEELFDWTIEIANSKNPYIPFGTLRYAECKSLKEYEYMLAEGDKRLTRGEEDAEFRHNVRLELQKIKDAKNIWGAIRRKDVTAIRVMLDRGLDLNVANEDGLTIKQALAEQEISL